MALTQALRERIGGERLAEQVAVEQGEVIAVVGQAVFYRTNNR